MKTYYQVNPNTIKDPDYSKFIPMNEANRDYRKIVQEVIDGEAEIVVTYTEADLEGQP